MSKQILVMQQKYYHLIGFAINVVAVTTKCGLIEIEFCLGWE